MQSVPTLLIPGETELPITVEAVYENGVLKPTRPLVLTEGSEVRLSVTPIKEDQDPLGAVIRIGEGLPDGAVDHDKYIYAKPRP
jgi:predicted DNA-binding antitoxin AbrB/MazE fold protein